MLYVNGNFVPNNLASYGPSTTTIASLWIGARSDNSYYFPGSIANLQVYNTSLTANQIRALYLKGIGGAPQVLQNLVGWWPLNGNANDYSGEADTGVPTVVTYVGQWQSGYTPP